LVMPLTFSWSSSVSWCPGSSLLSTISIIWYIRLVLAFDSKCGVSVSRYALWHVNELSLPKGIGQNLQPFTGKYQNACNRTRTIKCLSLYGCYQKNIVLFFINLAFSIDKTPWQLCLTLREGSWCYHICISGELWTIWLLILNKSFMETHYKYGLVSIWNNILQHPKLFTHTCILKTSAQFNCHYNYDFL
jgi:hypothetical protein